VKESRVVVAAPPRRDHQVDLARDPRRGAEGTGTLARPRLCVEVDVLLGRQVEAQPRERGGEGVDEPIGGERGVEVRRPEEPRQVRAPQAGKLQPRARESGREGLGVRMGGAFEEALGLRPKPL
jgi:hypothetical protein